MAIPLGDLNTPIKESMRPKIHIIQPITGIQPKNNPIKARINPATPIPLEFFSI